MPKLKLSHESDPQNIPDVVVSPLEFKPKRVFYGLIVGAVVVTIGVTGAFFLTDYFNPKATPVPPIEIKKATDSAKQSTTSAQKDETANWKTYSSENFTIKYPRDFTVKEYNDDPQIYFYSADYNESKISCQGAPNVYQDIIYMDRGGMVRVGVNAYTPDILEKKDFLTYMIDFYSGPNNKQLPDTKIDTQRAVVFEYDWTELGKKFDRCGDPLGVEKQFITESKKGDKVDIIINYADNQLKNILETMVSTFKFLD